MEAWPTVIGIAEQIFDLFMSLDSEGQDAMLRDIDRSVVEINSMGPAPLDDLAPDEETTELSSFQRDTVPKEENTSTLKRVQPATYRVHHDTVPSLVLVQLRTDDRQKYNPVSISLSGQKRSTPGTSPTDSGENGSGKSWNEYGSLVEGHSVQGHGRASFEHDKGVYYRSLATSGDQRLCVPRPSEATHPTETPLSRATNGMCGPIDKGEHLSPKSYLFETDYAAEEARNASEFPGRATGGLHAPQAMTPVKSVERALQFFAPFLPPAGSSLSFEPHSSMIASSAKPNVMMPLARAPFENSLGANLLDQNIGRNSEAGPSRTENRSVNEASAPYDAETRTCLLTNCKQFNKSFKNKKDFWRHVRSTQDHKGQVGSAAGPKCSTCGEVFSRDDSLGRHIRTVHGVQLSRRPDAVALT